MGAVVRSLDAERARRSRVSRAMAPAASVESDGADPESDEELGRGGPVPVEEWPHERQYRYRVWNAYERVSRNDRDVPGAWGTTQIRRGDHEADEVEAARFANEVISYLREGKTAAEAVRLASAPTAGLEDEDAPITLEEEVRRIGPMGPEEIAVRNESLAKRCPEWMGMRPLSVVDELNRKLFTENDMAVPIEERIVQSLQAGPLSVRELVEATGANATDLGKALRRMMNAGRTSVSGWSRGAKWSLSMKVAGEPGKPEPTKPRTIEDVAAKPRRAASELRWVPAETHPGPSAVTVNGPDPNVSAIRGAGSGPGSLAPGAFRPTSALDALRAERERMQAKVTKLDQAISVLEQD